MPGQHSIRKSGTRKHLDGIQFTVYDTSTLSPQYFRVSQLPETLTAGKNLFRIKAHPDNLVMNSNIYVELLDFSGKVIYTQPLRYISSDQTRVVSVWVYPDASPGPATLRIAGRAKRHAFENNRNLRYVTNDNNSPLYYNFPNVIWTKDINIAPDRRNNSEIIFTQEPQVTVREIVKPYMQPIDIAAQFRYWPANGATVTVDPAPGASNTYAAANNTYNAAVYAPAFVSKQEGQFSPNTPIFGQSMVTAPTLALTKADLQTAAAVTSAPYSMYTPSDQSTITFEGWHELSASMVGGTVTINNPVIEYVAGTALNSDGQVMPAGSAGYVNMVTAASGEGPSETTYVGTISSIVNDQKAKITPFEWLYGYNSANVVFANASQGAGTKAKGMDSAVADTIKPSSDFTMSFWHPGEIQLTENSMSYAEIILSNIEPATGDVYKIGAYFKPGGAIGQFQHLGDTVLEKQNMLMDTGSEEMTGQSAIDDKSIGTITNQAHINNYFETGSQGVSVSDFAIAKFSTYPLFGAMKITSGSDSTTAFQNQDALFATIKDDYSVTVTKDTEYILSFGAIGETAAEIDPGPSVPASTRVDIYISGSASGSALCVTPDVTTYTQPSTIGANPEDTLAGDYADGKKYGTRIGTFESGDGVYNEDVQFKFLANYTDEIKPFFVVRKGAWNIRDIKLIVNRETGFSPNYVRTLIRIPSEHMNTPLTFQFKYFDYQGTQAETITYVYGAVFDGDNTYIEGGSNLLSGSMYIGNTVGSGIEMAGIASGFIRSVGFEGFTSASNPVLGGGSGFLLYSGSVLTDVTDDYAEGGIGMDMISGSNDFFSFHTSGPRKGVKIRTDKFFLGGDSAFISGANGNLEITSSNFHLSSSGAVTMQGTITATAGGTIGGWDIESDKIISSDDAFAIDSNGPYHISSSKFQVNTAGDITASSGWIGGFRLNAHSLSAPIPLTGGAQRNQIEIRSGYDVANSASSDYQPRILVQSTASAGGRTQLYYESEQDYGILIGDTLAGSPQPYGTLFQAGTTNSIAGWGFDQKKIFNTGIHLSASYGLKVYDGTDDNNDFVEMKYLASDDYGVKGVTGGNTVFQLGSTNDIAGWTFDNEKLVGGNMIIRKDGTIESDGFVSNQAGSGFRLTAAQGGFLEVENAKIRGTLATATFEKETVNAVGGQLYVANSTTLTSSVLVPDGIHTASMATMSVANVSGFASGEILAAKKVSPTGFATEYIYVDSASRNNATSDTDLSGYLFVQRGYSGSTPGVSGSLGDLASAAQAYSGSQVLVSTGKQETGFIRLNANPNDPTTPYIDIVERTGSAIYDIDLKARLGDLSGITDNRFSDGVTGYGLYTENGYFSGKIEVASLPKAPPNDNLVLHLNFANATGSSFLNQANYSVGGEDITSGWNIANPATSHGSGSNAITSYALKLEEGAGTYVYNTNTWQHDGSTSIPIHSASFASWFKCEDVTHNGPQLIYEQGGTTSGVALWVSASNVYFKTFVEQTNASDEDNLCSASIDSGEWYHVAGTYNRTSTSVPATSSLYLNGVLKQTANTETKTTLLSHSGQSGIGATWNNIDISIHQGTKFSLTSDGSAAFTGSIDELRVYAGKTLTGEEVQSLYLSPGGTSPGSTIIDGGSISTGELQSSNLGESAGSVFNLNDGTFKLGGTGSPKLEWNGNTLAVEGTVTANAGEIGGFTISTDLTSTGGTLNLKGATGQITGSEVLFTGGTIGGFEIGTTHIHGTGTGGTIFATSGSGTRIEMGGPRNGVTFYEVQYPTADPGYSYGSPTEQKIFEFSTEAAGTSAGGETLDSTGYHVHGGQAAIMIRNGASFINKSGQLFDDYAANNSHTSVNSRVFAPTNFICDKTLHGHTEGGSYYNNLAGNGDYPYDGADVGYLYYPEATYGGVNRVPNVNQYGNYVMGGTAATYTFMKNGTPNSGVSEISNLFVPGGGASGGSSNWYGFAAAAPTHYFSQWTWGKAPKCASANVMVRTSATTIAATGYFEMVNHGLSNSPELGAAVWAVNSEDAGYSFYGQSGILRNVKEIQSLADVVAFKSSDRRLKKNIKPIKNALPKILKLNGVSFNWKDHENAPQWTKDKYFGDPSGSLKDVGIIAQEVEEVLPEVTRDRHDGFKAVDYEKIVPLLIEGIKDQQSQINELKNKITKLEKR